MKQIIFLFILATTLFANDFVEEFFNQQIALETTLHEQNLSAETLETTLDEQARLYKRFFVDFISKERSDTAIDPNPYRSEAFKLKRRIQANKQRDNSYAILRDELKLATLVLKQNIRSSMNEVIQATKLGSYKEFEDNLQVIITKRHENEPHIDIEKYTFLEGIADPDPLILNVKENMDEYRYIQNIHTNLSAALIEDAQTVYKAGVISGYGLLAFAMKISNTAVAKNIDPYLSYIYLSSAKFVYITIILLFAFVLRKMLIFGLRRLLNLVSRQEDDIHYIIARISSPFTLFTIILTSELIVMVYSGVSDVRWLITFYNITYVFIVSFFIYRLGNAIAVIKMEQLERNKYIRNEVINLGLKAMNGLVAFIALILILKMLNVNLTAILSGLGIGGIAVAFAAKDTLANFFGSVSILLTDLFEQGDWIAVDTMEGTVVEIGLRATTIRTFDNALIAIPNSKLADNGIKNWSRRLMGRRIKMSIGVTYESDMNNIKKAIAEIREMLQNHLDIVTEKSEYMSSERQLKLVSKEDSKGIKRTIMVYLDTFGSSSIDILVYCFSRSVVWVEWHEVKEDVMFKIADILKENDLEFAYPTMMLHQPEGRQDITE